MIFRDYLYRPTLKSVLNLTSVLIESIEKNIEEDGNFALRNPET